MQSFNINKSHFITSEIFIGKRRVGPIVPSQVRVGLYETGSWVLSDSLLVQACLSPVLEFDIRLETIHLLMPSP